MKRWFFTSVLSVGLLGMVWESTVQAQGYSPYFPQTMGYQGPGRPALSPYLDLTRGGNAAANYYLGTLPEINRRAVTTLQNAAIRDLERTVESPRPGDEPLLYGREGPLPPTGHAATFVYYGGYYNIPNGPSPIRPPRGQMTSSTMMTQTQTQTPRMPGR